MSRTRHSSIAAATGTNASRRVEPLCPSRPSSAKQREPWRHPLWRARRALESTLARIDLGRRIIDASERFAAAGRKVEAMRQLELVPAFLSKAAGHLNRACSALQTTNDRADEAPGRAAVAPALLMETGLQWIQASVLILDLTGRFDELFARLVDSATTDPASWFITAEGWKALATPEPPTFRPAATLRLTTECRDTHPAAAEVRRICRGRAPPLV